MAVPKSYETYDCFEALKSLYDLKPGVKGLVDASITKVPRIFVRSPEERTGNKPICGKENQTQFKIPVIDLKKIADDRGGIVSSVRQAAKDVGFFQVVNHEIPIRLLKEMLEVAPGFHELPKEVKAEYYTREVMKKVK